MVHVMSCNQSLLSFNRPVDLLCSNGFVLLKIRLSFGLSPFVLDWTAIELTYSGVDLEFYEFFKKLNFLFEQKVVLHLKNKRWPSCQDSAISRYASLVDHSAPHWWAGVRVQIKTQDAGRGAASPCPNYIGRAKWKNGKEKFRWDPRKFWGFDNVKILP